jgi:hypothetical protein
LFVGPKELRAASLQIFVVRQTFAGDYVEPQIPRRQSQIGRHLLELEAPPQTSLLQPSPQILCENWTEANSKSSSPTILEFLSFNIAQYVALTSGFTFRSLTPNSAFCTSSPERNATAISAKDSINSQSSLESLLP